jgi:hypothetical protein
MIEEDITKKEKPNRRMYFLLIFLGYMENVEFRKGKRKDKSRYFLPNSK